MDNAFPIFKQRLEMRGELHFLTVALLGKIDRGAEPLRESGAGDQAGAAQLARGQRAVCDPTTDGALGDAEQLSNMARAKEGGGAHQASSTGGSIKLPWDRCC